MVLGAVAIGSMNPRDAANVAGTNNSNGDKYWGELHYIDSQIKRQGRGIYVWADGRKYEG
jgi:hypothetical protein